MADNFTGKDASGTDQTFASTDVDGVHRPLKRVERGDGSAVASEAKQDNVISALGALATQATLSAISSTLTTCATLLTNILAALTVTAPVTQLYTAADTAAHAFASLAVKAPVTIAIRQGMIGKVSIVDSDGGAIELSWDDTNKRHKHFHTFYVSNIDQLSYQFDTNAGTEQFELSTAT